MRIAYITDTHLGATNEGFQQQPRWVGGLGVLLKRLQDWMDVQGVALLIHGGDVVDHGTADEISDGCKMLAALGRPVVVCMGNHDLMTRQAWGQWQTEAARHRHLTLADACLAVEGCDVIALNNRWVTGGQADMYWDGQYPVESLTAAQLDWLASRLSGAASRPGIVVVHAPAAALLPELTGLDKPIHPPDGSYAQTLVPLLAQAGRPVLLLAGHCHATYARRAGATLTSTSAFSEPPFQVRLIEPAGATLRVGTYSLARGDEPVRMDPARMWTAGRPADREMAVTV